MNTFFEHARSILKENTTPIVFAGVILFAVLSVWNNARVETIRARELLVYAQDSVRYVFDSTQNISVATLPLQNTSANYQQSIDQLKQFSVEVIRRRDAIPREPREGSALELQAALTGMLDTISQESLDLIERQAVLQDIVEPLERMISSCSTPETINTEAFVQDSKIVSERATAASSVVQTYLDSVYIPELSGIAAFSDVVNSQDGLSFDTIQSVCGTLNGADIGFAIISRSDIETEEVYDAIEKMEQLFEDIKHTYSIKT